MMSRSKYEPNVTQAKWSKREILLTVVICSCLIGWFVFHEVRMGQFRDKTHLVKVGMSFNDAVAILGTPTKRQESKEESLLHEQRSRWVELGKDNPLTRFNWDRTGYRFYAYVVTDEIIATGVRRKSR